MQRGITKPELQWPSIRLSPHPEGCSNVDYPSAGNCNFYTVADINTNTFSIHF